MMVDEYLDEREQAEQLKQWFKENWLWLVAGVGLGLGGLYGWQGWNAHLDRRSQEAGALFSSMLDAFDRNDRAAGTDLAGRISDEYGTTAYADQTLLVLARVHAEAGELGEAAARLRQVMETSEDAELALVARLRLARVQSAQGEQDAALATLRGAQAPSVDPRIAELEGDLLAAKGEVVAAREAYERAIAEASGAAAAGLVDADYVQLKLDALASGAAPPAAASGS
jgi:predicted negative regulator of RcsB-dependent stress response